MKSNTYTTIQTVGSNRSRKRHQRTDVPSIQVLWDPEGGPLPQGEHSSAVRRAWSSKYKRHVGAKQKAKAKVRDHVAA